jgi:hypothetical protein
VKEDDVSAKLLRMGRDLQSRVKGFFETTLDPDAAPLELLQATLDELERKVQPAGRGRRVFPYDRIVVRIAQPGADAVAIGAVFDQLEQRLRDRLRELQCEAPDSIRSIVAVETPIDRQPLLAVECSSEPAERPAHISRTQQHAVRVTVVKGQCVEPEYVFEEPIVRIGRQAEPADAYGLIRINHIAFLEVRDGINETVARAHARLQFDAASGHYHLFNESSSNPTSIVRNGRTIRVEARDPRGVRLQSGDQVQLGRAVLRVSIGNDSR